MAGGHPGPAPGLHAGVARAGQERRSRVGQHLRPLPGSRRPTIEPGAGEEQAGISRSRRALPDPGGSEQIMFETERAVGVTAGKIAQVWSLWPGRDEYIDHTAALLKGEPVRP